MINPWGYPVVRIEKGKPQTVILGYFLDMAGKPMEMAPHGIRFSRALGPSYSKPSELTRTEPGYLYLDLDEDDIGEEGLLHIEIIYYGRTMNFWFDVVEPPLAADGSQGKEQADGKEEGAGKAAGGPSSEEGQEEAGAQESGVLRGDK